MPTPPVVAVTGANGYVGSIICEALLPHAQVIRLVRTPRAPKEHAWSFDMSTDAMTQLLDQQGASHVIHAAWDMTDNDLGRLTETCVEGTRRLVMATQSRPTRRFSFISSISAFSDARSAYGRSKYLAERHVVAQGGMVYRLGLVFGATGGGVFGSLSSLATRLPVIPHIVGGSGVQFLIHHRSLSVAMVRAVNEGFVQEGGMITLAHPRPVPLDELLRQLASAHRRRTILVPVPWRVIYALLRCAELLHLPTKVRSDSLLGFVYQNPQPDFTPLHALQIDMEPWDAKQAADSR